jgi:hypothetical protein
MYCFLLEIFMFQLSSASALGLHTNSVSTTNAIQDSDVVKGYRVEDQALEMDQKVGDSFWNAQEGGEKRTNKKTSNLLVA